MKKTILSLALLLIFALTGNSQDTILFHEDFEPLSGCDSMTSSLTSTGSPAWNTTTSLYTSGTTSVHCQVQPSMITYLTSQSFSTIGQTNVMLNFSQICKVDFSDGGRIEVSNNNGINWTILTGDQYLGTGQFATNGNRFSSNSYGGLWMPGLPTQVPINTWWRSEQFDITALVAGYSNVKVRFRLDDGGSIGPVGNYGWLLDNINVIGNLSNPLLVHIYPSAYSICEGQSLQLNGAAFQGSGNYNFSWSSIPSGLSSFLQNLVVSPVVSTTYYLTVDDGIQSITTSVLITVFPMQSTIDGTINYLNLQNTGMPDCMVNLYSGSTLISSVTSDATGNFHFGNITAGSYIIKPVSCQVYGGINAIDALNITKHYLNLVPLTGFYLKAADVNADLTVNSVDALLVLKRFVGMQNSFPAGDWVFEEKMVNLGCTAPVTEILHIVCTGDTDGSWHP